MHDWLIRLQQLCWISFIFADIFNVRNISTFCYSLVTALVVIMLVDYFVVFVSCVLVIAIVIELDTM
jgi:hypothetical protein